MQFTGGKGEFIEQQHTQRTVDRLGRTRIDASFLPPTTPQSEYFGQQQQQRYLSHLHANMRPQSPPPPPPEAEKKPLWGEPTWTFLHTLAERVDPYLFQQYREELMHVVQSVCHNLPCTDCANHAKAFLDRVDVRNLRSKDQFRYFLCDFHNTVNARKNYPPFDPMALADHYVAHEFMPVAARFMRVFANPQSSKGAAALHNGSFQRAHAVQFLRTWCDGHMFLFERSVQA